MVLPIFLLVIGPRLQASGNRGKEAICQLLGHFQAAGCRRVTIRLMTRFRVSQFSDAQSRLFVAVFELTDFSYKPSR